ncbi:MAG: DUF2079 domain-containing protein [Chloroflexi bacterium]|nr:DUF2079 domain-containing protein [Chloroflexota bacterium]
MTRIIRENRILIMMTLGWAVVLAAFAIARHERLNSSAYDLAIKSQVIWNTYQGRFFASSIEVEHYLGDHVQLIMLLLAPLYGIWANVEILLITQSALLSLGAIPIYRIARRTLDHHALALVFAIAYLLYPVVGFVNRFDFHPLTFVILFLLLAFDFLEINRLKWANVFIVLALICREDVGLTVFALGIYVALVKKQRALGTVWAIIGLTWSLTAFFVVIPYFRGATSDTFYRYGWLGADVSEMLTTMLTRPGFVLNYLFSDPLRRQFLAKLFLPVGFLAFLSPLPLMIGLPALGYNLLSAVPSQSSIYFQYVSPVVPFIFVAAIQGTARALKWLPQRIASSKRRAFVAGWLGVGLAAAWALDNPFTQTIDDPYFSVYALEQISDRNAFLAAKELVSPEASVATMMGYAPHLSLRPELALFYHRLWLEERPFGFPQSDYLFLNLTDLRWGVNARIFYAGIETAIGHYGYEAIYYQNDVVLLTQTPEPQPKTATGAVLQRVIDLQEAGGKFAPTAPATLDWMGQQWTTDKLPDTAVPQPVQFANDIQLIGYQLSENTAAPGRPLCATLYWQTTAPATVDYAVFLHFVDETGYVHTQRDTVPAFGFHPFSHWQPDEIVGDMHCLQIPPHLSPENYWLNIGIYDAASGSRLPITSAAAAEPAPGALRLTSILVR